MMKAATGRPLLSLSVVNYSNQGYLASREPRASMAMLPRTWSRIRQTAQVGGLSLAAHSQGDTVQDSAADEQKETFDGIPRDVKT
jgi:hypothetical protein